MVAAQRDNAVKQDWLERLDAYEVRLLEQLSINRSGKAIGSTSIVGMLQRLNRICRRKPCPGFEAALRDQVARVKNLTECWARQLRDEEIQKGLAHRAH